MLDPTGRGVRGLAGPEFWLGGRRVAPARLRLRVGPWRPPPWLVLLALFALLGSFAGWAAFRIDRLFRPQLVAIAEVKARELASQAINEAITADILSGVEYERLIRVIMDPSQRRVLLVQPDTVAINRIADRATRAADQALRRLNGQRLAVPVGQVLGYTLLARLGPDVAVVLEPVGSVVSIIRSEFEAAGVNQAHHRIILQTTASVRIVLPLVSRDVDVVFQTVLAEAIIHGEVPQTYWSWRGELGGSRLR